MPWRMSRHFLGSRASITEARRFVSYLLKDWPVVEEAELIVSELATNAIRHTASGRFGGRFVVSVHAQPGQLWLGVMDEGGNGTPELLASRLDEPGGRGLLIVSRMSVAWGVSGDDNGRTVWAILPTPVGGIR